MSHAPHAAFDAAGQESLYPASNASTYLNSPTLDASYLAGFLTLQSPTVTVGLCVVIALVLGRIFGRRKLPQGVKPLPRLPGLPWAGRFWDVPEQGVDAAFHFGALHKKYGPIYEWKVMGTTHIWLETDKVARDLFVLRQKKYCDRNILPAAMGVKEDCEILPLSGYSDEFKKHKNFIHTLMKDSTPKTFYGWPLVENKRTLRRLLESPERWSEHMITHCARTIGSIAWANPEHGNKLLIVVPDLLKAVSPAGPIINKLTFLRHLPAAISPFKKFEAKRKQLMQDAFYEALQDVKDRVEAGNCEDCWSQLYLAEEKRVPEARKMDWHEAAYAIGSSSFVAIATIGGPLHSFFLAAAHYPEWLPKVQEEIDRVCGDRLPTVEDMPHLPKIRATVKEVLRWRQSTPLGVPHEAMEDDVYEGYFIPKGAMLHANHYLISREADKFPRANEFVPERWIDPSYPSYKEPLTEFPNIRGDMAFGYGSRACPGVELTNMELCTLFGALAWAFNFTSKIPKEDLPWYEVNPYVITMSKPFPMDIQPRSEAKRRFIENECGDAGYVLKTKREGKWDIVHEAGEKEPWTWDGLSVPYEKPAVKRVYPEGA
ncbi:cytochrome p450 monooxygenase psod [Acrodontium crateriforme]|uniref:Cytochrome p450 monooxygenase psod n=1 Tax=Acrodontium crateriforme TaxID=150365 RepID=A0AAQ3MDC5_9PEZI|nr:cytochrome p450 monooxygenase psod [Acrodontium crateriforme]